MDHVISDNFLDRESFESIKEVVMGSNTIPWFLSWGVSSENAEGEGAYFTHTFYSDYQIISEYFKLLVPIFKQVRPKALIRARANMSYQTSERIYHGMHTDYPYEHKGLILYLNDNDSCTVLEDGTEVECRENRILFFDPSKEHSSTTCTDQTVRSIIIVNYF